MAISRQKKEKILKNLIEKIKKAKLLILLNYQGVTVPEVQKLRKILKEENIDYLVVKKTLIEKAFQKNNIKGLAINEFKMPVSLIVSKEADPAAVRLLSNFQKETNKTEFIKGFLEGEILDKDALKALAAIPKREELLAKLVYSIASPLSGFVYVMKANLNSLVYALDRIREKKA